jgi:hypothetical protein
VHDYLGMELDFGSCPGTMIISMIKYLLSVWAQLNVFFSNLFVWSSN